MPRGNLPISRTCDESGYETESSDNLSPWMRAVVNRLNNEKQSQNMHSQMNAYMSNKRYATVEDAVIDMRQRTGLDEYIKSIKQAEELKNKKTAKQIIAMINSYQIPSTFSKYDCAEDLIEFIKNIIKNSHGFGASVPQIQHDILNIFAPKRCDITEQELNEEDVVEFIKSLIREERDRAGEAEVRKNLGLGVGKDLSVGDNDDYFGGLNPAKG